MNSKIEYILKHNRFQFTTLDRVILTVLMVIIFSAIVFIGVKYPRPVPILASIIFGLLAASSIYKGYLSSMEFKSIKTPFSQIDNEDLIKYSLKQLNFKVFKDKEYSNVFVCFIHDRMSGARQEIYVIAKDLEILISTDKTKATDNVEGGVDYVDRIGMTIYQNLARLMKKMNLQPN